MPRLPKVFAVSDLHANNKENMSWILSLCPQQHAQDILIVAGDVSEVWTTFQQAMRHLCQAFRAVFFVPGNHDLYVTQGDRKRGTTDSFMKLRDIQSFCDTEGIITSPKTIDGVRIVPFKSWYHSSWDREPDIPEDAINASSRGRYRLQGYKAATDFHLCKFPGYEIGEAALALHLDSMNPEVTEAQDPEASVVISFSHFLPVNQLLPEKRFLLCPWLPKISGSDPLRQRVDALRPNIHVFGHTHVCWDQSASDGIRYVQNPLGASPAERKKGFIEPEWQLTLHQLCGPDGTCPPRQERWAQRYADTPRDATVTTPADYVVSFWN